MLQCIAGFIPELSVAVGVCQLTLIFISVASSIVMSFGQYVKTGGSSSGKEHDIHLGKIV